MRTPIAMTAAVLVFGLSACGSSPSADPSPGLTTTTDSVASSPATTSAAPAPSLRDAVQAYSDAYLTGKGSAAFAMLSRTCQVQIGRSSFVSEVSAAGQQFGNALPLKSFSSKPVDATHALATYTYDVSSIDQADQRWTLVGGAWKYDAC